MGPRAKQAASVFSGWLLLAGLAPGAHADDGLAGPASVAVRAWFVGDRTLGCVDPDGHDRLCRVDSSPHYQVYYGNAEGGPGQPDAIAIVTYLTDPTGNGEQVAVAEFRQDVSGAFRFVKTFRGLGGGGPAPGSGVRFGAGHASWDTVVGQPYGARAPSSARQHVSVALR